MAVPARGVWLSAAQQPCLPSATLLGQHQRSFRSNVQRLLILCPRPWWVGAGLAGKSHAAAPWSLAWVISPSQCFPVALHLSKSIAAAHMQGREGCTSGLPEPHVATPRGSPRAALLCWEGKIKNKSKTPKTWGNHIVCTAQGGFIRLRIHEVTSCARTDVLVFLSVTSSTR